MQPQPSGKADDDGAHRVAVLPAGQRRIVLGLLAGLLLTWLVVFFPMGNGDTDSPIPWYLAWIGSWLAQASLPAIWATMASQPLSVRLPRALGVAAVLTLATVWATARSEFSLYEIDLTTALIVVTVPLTLLGPLSLVRWWPGWRIGLPETPIPDGRRTTSQFSIRQLLVWTAATAALLAWAKCLMPRGATFQADIPENLFLGALFAAAHLPIILAGAGLVLADRRRLKFAISLPIATILSGAGLMCLFTWWPQRAVWSEAAQQVACLVGGFLIALLGTLLVVRLCGYRLLQRRRPDPLTPVTAGRGRFYGLLGALLIVVLLLCQPAIRRETIRSQQGMHARLVQQWSQVGADIDTDGEGERETVQMVTFLANEPVPDDGLKKLAELRGSDCFESLRLCDTRVTDAQLRHLRGFGQLRTLDLSNTSISDAGLAELDGLNGLTTLDLSGTRIGDQGLKYLRRFPRLEVLWLDGTPMTGAGLLRLYGLAALRELRLDGTAITDLGLAQLDGLEGLTHLSLCNTRIGDRGLAQLGRLSSLDWLDLSDTSVTGTGLGALDRLPSLKSLNLSGSAVRDENLASLARLTNLEYLVLDDTRITDVGLAQLRPLKKLRLVRLYRTPVTGRGVVQLIRSVPNCEVRFGVLPRSPDPLVWPRADIQPGR
jgi:hypothetical protein